MHTKVQAILLLALAPIRAQQQASTSPVPAAARVLRMSNAEISAYVGSAFDHGMSLEFTEDLPEIVRFRSVVAVPILEQKIEAALQSPSPAALFVGNSINPNRAINLAAGAIAYACDEHALRELGKLVMIDDERFGWQVGQALDCGAARNFFPVAYAGFAIDNEALSKKMASWIERQFADRTEFRQGQLKHWWAEAMAERYKNVPLEVQWVNDPIVKRIKPELAASLHDEVLRTEMEISAPHGKR